MPTKTMFDKIWERHAILEEDDETLLYVDRCLLHEGSSHTFENAPAREMRPPLCHPERNRGTAAIAHIGGCPSTALGMTVM